MLSCDGHGIASVYGVLMLLLRLDGGPIGAALGLEQRLVVRDDVGLVRDRSQEGHGIRQALDVCIAAIWRRQRLARIDHGELLLEGREHAGRNLVEAATEDERRLARRVHLKLADAPAPEGAQPPPRAPHVRGRASRIVLVFPIILGLDGARCRSALDGDGGAAALHLHRGPRAAAGAAIPGPQWQRRQYRGQLEEVDAVELLLGEGRLVGAAQEEGPRLLLGALREAVQLDGGVLVPVELGAPVAFHLFFVEGHRPGGVALRLGPAARSLAPPPRERIF
mmetsp:Transcript_24659/g.77313  ORF Transcript_24659/g.77313 Transcript_24659/m.77313 type:complete len:280 (-) Transcript_24659:83-922(-)